MSTVKNRAPLTASQHLTETLAIALAYISTAVVGFAVAIPPGNVTPVWPPSGLALAAVLVVGYRSAVGIWLGSFVANAWFFTHSIALSTPTAAVHASSIATGSTLQALLAAYLIRRLVGTMSPDRLNDAVKFLGVAAVTCFTASSWGVTTLVLADLVPWGTYSYTWFTWWLGDFAGILVITPSLLVLSGEAYAKQLSQKMTFPLLGFGSGLTLIGFFALWQIERQAVEANLNAAHSIWPWGFLLAGLAFTALLAAYIETHRREATLLAARNDLETRVQARTRELAQANRELRAEIAERERAEASLCDVQARLRLALQSSNTGLWDWNLTSNEVYFSPEWKRQLGHEDDKVPNRYEEWESRLHPEDRVRTLNAVRASIENPACGYEVEFRLRHKDGTYRWILARASLLQDAEGRAYRMLGSHTDITDRKEAEAQLAQLALCDGLTGLGNRRWIEEELERALIASRRNRQKIAVMFIDLDRFKDINDTLGHEAGDSLLKGVAERLRPEVRESDAVARLGGDEFIVILIDIARPEDAANVARKLLRTLSAPMNLGGTEMVISASIGISLSPEDGSDVKTLLHHADTALYRAKESGKNDYCFYAASLSARANSRY
ncbi:MAG: diguanylate cyclase domain-containing protein [Gammaproteobacteria bacterium]